MFFSAGLCATLAGVAGAMLVPPSVQMSDVPALVDPYTQLLQVDCIGCKYAKPMDDGFVWTDNVENALLLNISVGTDSHTLELNGVQFYPPVMSLMSRPPVPYISQVPAGLSLVQLREKASNYLSRPLRLSSWGFQAGSARTVNDSGEEVLKIHLILNALEQQPIHVPRITITALKNTNAQLMILKVETEAAQSQDTCTDWPFLCKWRAIMSQRLDALKGRIRGFKCQKHHGQGHHGQGHHGHGNHRRPHHEGRLPPFGATPGDEDSIGQPAHLFRESKHYGNHHDGHHKLRRIMHTIARVVLTVLIPILIGVCAGIITYMVGMMLGTGVALLWIKFRGGNVRYAPIALDDTDEQYDAGRGSFEKGDFVEDIYVESPPLYVEVEVEAEVEEKEVVV